MEGNRFTFCPQCGSRAIQTERNGYKWKCPDCGFDLYCNVASAVGLVVVNDRDEILFEKRAKEPRKGYLAFPGGFTDVDESGEAAAVRECTEETGVVPQDVHYLCSFPNTYEYKSIVYKTCDLFFTGRLPAGATFHAQKSEVDGFVWMKVESPADVDQIPLAFDSAKKTLLKWLECKQKEYLK